jgi:hypothetical protein
MHRRHKPHYGRDRKKRAKTFKTLEKAKAWAEANKMTKYEINQLQKDKFRVDEL